MEAAVGSEHRDRLSELPNSLTHLILAFLPMREVVSTTFLSKRWKDLWKTVPCLYFCDNLSELENGADSFRNFVNRVLMFWKGRKISKFKIDIAYHFDRSLAGDIDLWLRFAIENEVDELYLHLMYEPEMNFEEWVNDHRKCSKKEIFYAPQCLNECSSMTKLSLACCNLRIRKSTSWNQLKSLRIDGFCYSEQVINRILLGSPILEVFELRLVESYENLNIRSVSLKRLKFEKYLFYNYEEQSSDDNVLRICCPNLEVLEFSGVLYPKYVFTNVSSLTDVTLGFEDMFETCYANYESLGQIFSTIQYVDKVTLSPWCVQVLSVLQKKYLLSPLPNLKFFPNLKTLDVIEDIVDPWYCRTTKYEGFETQLSKSFLVQLKTVNITSSLCGASTFRFIEFLLKEASMLEKLVIWDRNASYREADNWSKLAEALLCMQRSSPDCKGDSKKILIITRIFPNHIKVNAILFWRRYRLFC